MYIYNQLHPPFDCSMSVYIYRNISDFDLVLSLLPEQCEKFLWNIHFMSNKTNVFHNIYTNFPESSFIFLDEDRNPIKEPYQYTPTVHANISELEDFTQDFDSRATESEISYINRNLLENDETWYSYYYCDRCNEIEIIQEDEVCDNKLSTLSLISGLYWACSAVTVFLWILVFVPCCIYLCRIVNDWSGLCWEKYSRYDYYDSLDNEDGMRSRGLFVLRSGRGDTMDMSRIVDSNQQSNNVDENSSLLRGETRVLLIPDADQNTVIPSKKTEVGSINPSNVSNNMNLPQEMLCVICMENPRNCLIIDCSHAAFCCNCLRKILITEQEKNRKCPICRMPIKKGAKKIFLV